MYIHKQKERQLQIKSINICCHIVENYKSSQEFQKIHHPQLICVLCELNAFACQSSKQVQGSGQISEVANILEKNEGFETLSIKNDQSSNRQFSGFFSGREQCLSCHQQQRQHRLQRPVGILVLHCNSAMKESCCPYLGSALE